MCMMFNNSSRNSTQTLISDPYYGKIPWTVAFSLQFFIAMIGNFLIMCIVYKDKRLKTTTNYLITNMAASDLIAGLISFPVKIVKINFDGQWMIVGDIGSALCKLTFFTVDTSVAVSAYSCVAIAIDRYFAVAHPFKRPFEGKMKHVIAVIWIISAVLNLPVMSYLVIIQNGSLSYCSVSNKDRSSSIVYLYVVGVALTSVLPALFIAITYLLTICKLYHHKIPGKQTAQRRKREQQNKKVLKHAVTIAVLLFICHGFWVIVMLLNAQGKLNDLSSSMLLNLLNAAIFIPSLTLVYNFFIYLIFNDIYRENIKDLITKCCCRSDSN